MNRFCNIIMTISALAVVLSTVIITIRDQRRLTGPNPKAMLLHKVYAGQYSCSGSNYFSYTSPFGCYNPRTYDRNEQYDTYDEILEWTRYGRPTLFRRKYYYSKDGSCQDQIEGAMDENSLWGSPCTTSAGENNAVSVEELLIYGI